MKTTWFLYAIVAAALAIFILAGIGLLQVVTTMTCVNLSAWECFTVSPFPPIFILTASFALVIVVLAMMAAL